MDELYEFLLDFFPLVEEISTGNAVFGAALQTTALEILLSKEEDQRDRLRTLLRLAADLGYTSEEVVVFLDQRLSRIRT